ncbi:hypothetical protein MesoLjLc_48810 [Mesorhizobium sp. L-8-10]|nr:hypothetical protein MesoLjLc_48810 [Mesorhizobium sp. L-8-10]
MSDNGRVSMWMDSREQEVDCRSNPWFAGNADLAANHLRERAHLRQPYPGTLLALRCEERIEHPSQDFLWHAVAVILNANADMASRPCRVRCHGTLPQMRRDNSNLAAIWHGVPRIDDEIEDCGVEECRINQAVRDISTEF